MKATPPPGEKIYLAFSASPRLRVSASPREISSAPLLGLNA